MKMSGKMRVVGKKAVTIQSGDRKGEVVYRLDLSDGESTATDVAADLDVATFDGLVCFTKEYNCIFDYAVRAFNGKSFTSFQCLSLFPEGAK